MAQLVEYATSNDRLFYLWESGGGGGGEGFESHCELIFFLSFCAFLFNFISLLFYFTLFSSNY